MVPSLKFFCFWMKLCKLTNLRMLIFNTALVFSNFSPKYPFKTILVANLGIFIFRRNFVFGKIWEYWCKIPQYSSFFEFQPKNTKIGQFWSYIYKIFFATNITFWQTEGAEVKHDNSFFQVLTYKNSHIRYFQCKS